MCYACRFYSKLDILLNEDVLIGKSRACQEMLRPPAASTLAELIVHVRADLTLQQIQRIVYMFSRQATCRSLVQQQMWNVTCMLMWLIQTSLPLLKFPSA